MDEIETTVFANYDAVQKQRAMAREFELDQVLARTTKELVLLDHNTARAKLDVIRDFLKDCIVITGSDLVTATEDEIVAGNGKLQEQEPIPYYVHQYTNGGLSGDEYAGEAWFQINSKTNMFLHFHYTA